MRLLSRILPLVIMAAALASPVAVQAQNHTTNVTLANLVNIPAARVCAVAVDAGNNPITFSESGWGLITDKTPPFCQVTVSNALPSGLNLPDACNTNAAFAIRYTFTIQPLASGVPSGIASVIPNVPNVCTSTYSLDDYTPTTAVVAPLANVVAFNSTVPTTCTAPSILTLPNGSVYTCRAGSYGLVATSGFNLRGAWASSTSYAPYDVVTYSGSSYVVTSALTSGSSFSASNLTLLASVGLPGANGIASLPALALMQSRLGPPVNLLDTTKITADFYVDVSSGALVAQSGISTTACTPVGAGMPWVFSRNIISGGGGFAEFDQNGIFLRGDGTGYTSGTPITAHNDAACIRASYYTAQQSGVMPALNWGSTLLPYAPFGGTPASTIVTAAVAAVATDAPSMAAVNRTRTIANVDSINRYDDSQRLEGYYLDYTTGLTVAGTGFSTTGYIPVTSGFITTNIPLGDGAQGLYCYDSLFNPISGSGKSGGVYVANAAGITTIPVVGASCRFSFYDVHFPSYTNPPYAGPGMIVDGSTMPGYYAPYGISPAALKLLKPYAGKTIGASSDSILAGGGNYSGPETGDFTVFRKLNDKLGMKTGPYVDLVSGRSFVNALTFFSGSPLALTAQQAIGGTVYPAGTTLASLLATTDLFLIEYQANEVSLWESSPGSYTDTSSATTFVGKMRWLVEQLSAANPQMKIMWLPSYQVTNRYNTQTENVAMQTMMAQVLTDYGIPLLDLIHMNITPAIGLTPGNQLQVIGGVTSSNLTADGTHLSALGADTRFVDYVARQIQLH